MVPATRNVRPHHAVSNDRTLRRIWGEHRSPGGRRDLQLVANTVPTSPATAGGNEMLAPRADLRMNLRMRQATFENLSNNEVGSSLHTF